MIMDSHQPVVSLSKSSSVGAEPERQRSGFASQTCDGFTGKIGVHGKEGAAANSEDFIGVLEVYIHQARDIHNICIYHKQDVYAKLCLTSNPETTVSTQIINGGGKNPVFNENLRLKVRTVESSLKCEIWMLSRVKNYLEDQLLGFVLVPLSDVLIGNGKLAQEFSLSSTDLFHSPAGFVQLSLSYSGFSPEVVAIPAPQTSLTAPTPVQDSAESVPSDLDKIEFPDPKIVNENNLMVSEYFGISCTTLDPQSSESFSTSDTENNLSSDISIHVVESFSAGSVGSVEIQKKDTPPSSVSTNGSPSASIPASSTSFCDTSGTSKSPNQDLTSPLKEKGADVDEAESDSSAGTPSNLVTQPLLNIKIEPEQTVVQQDIVDMYMKSMQQFTESLAKMKLPMDMENGTTNSGNANSSSDPKFPSPKTTGSRVFYGSRAFF